MSLKFKTILGVALIEAILLALLISLTLDYLKSTNFESLNKRANTTATLSATTTKDAVLSWDLASLETFSNELMKNPDLVYVRIISPSGTIFSQAGDGQALAKSFSVDASASEVTDGIFDSQANIEEGGVIYGRVELGIDINSLEDQIDQAIQWSALIALGEMALVALFSFMLGSYLTGQLSRLRQAAHTLSSGEKNVQLDIKGSDELAEVAQAFNTMVSSLKQADSARDAYERELQTLNAQLEERVERRTAKLRENLIQLQRTNAELKQAQTQLIQSEKMASLGTLAAGVAHEVNNPLGFIMSNLKTLQEYSESYHQLTESLTELEGLSNEERLVLLKKVEQQLAEQDFEFIQQDSPELLKDTLEGAERVKDIVGGLKEFSHVDLENRYEDADLNDAVVQTLKVVNNEVKYKCKVVTQLAELPLIPCQIGQVKQVLLNLVINASHAISEQGTILIKTEQKPHSVELSVTDNGSGIAPEDQKKIFDPFFTTKEIGVGTGLGLSIAYGIMQEHGGNIRVKSQLGKGTRFTLTLPKVQHSKA